MAWLWWVGGALVLGVVETLTADLMFLMFAGGALGGGLTALLGGPFWLQVIVFSLLSTLLLAALRPWIKRRMAASAPEIRTNAEAQIGRRATALTPLDVRGGRVLLGGEEWSARLAEPAQGLQAQEVPVGASVTVTQIDGAVAVVEPVS